MGDGRLLEVSDVGERSLLEVRRSGRRPCARNSSKGERGAGSEGERRGRQVTERWGAGAARDQRRGGRTRPGARRRLLPGMRSGGCCSPPGEGAMGEMGSVARARGAAGGVCLGR